MNEMNNANASAAQTDNACCKPGGGSGGKYFAGGLIVGVIAGLFGGVFLGPVLESWTNSPMPAPAAGGARTPPPAARTPSDQTGGPGEAEQRPSAAPTGAPTGSGNP